jgi:ribosomal protein L40E
VSVPVASGKQVCPRCRAGNPPSYRYCAVCGAPLAQSVPETRPAGATVCPRCQWENPPGQRYCRGCGADLRQAAMALGTPPATSAPRAPYAAGGPFARPRGQSKGAASAGCAIMFILFWLFLVLSNVLRRW